MTGAGKTRSKSGADSERADRLAAALRSNLGRRKAQARARDGAGTIDDAGAPDVHESSEQT